MRKSKWFRGIAYVIGILFFANIVYHFYHADISMPSVRLNNGLNLLIVITGICAVLFLKGVRFYLILMEAGMRSHRFMKTYFETVFITITFPLKSGELYRIYRFTNEIGSLRTTVLSVITDRFFDIFGFLSILIFFNFKDGLKISYFEIVLIAILLLILLVYLSFKPIFLYFNRLLITNYHHKKAISALKILEIANISYEETKQLIRGRVFLLSIISSTVWVIEAVVLYTLVCMFELQISGFNFGAYVTEFFAGSVEPITMFYLLVTGSITLLITGCLMVFKKEEVHFDE